MQRQLIMRSVLLDAPLQLRPSVSFAGQTTIFHAAVPAGLTFPAHVYVQWEDWQLNMDGSLETVSKKKGKQATLGPGFPFSPRSFVLPVPMRNDLVPAGRSDDPRGECLWHLHHHISSSCQSLEPC